MHTHSHSATVLDRSNKIWHPSTQRCFHTYSSTTPPPRHTKRQTKTCVSNTLTLLTLTHSDASTNKQTNPPDLQLMSNKASSPSPHRQQPPPQIHWSHAGTASAVTNTSTPRSFQISPSALTSPFHHLLFPLHTHTISGLLLPNLSSIQTVFFRKHSY